MPHFTFHYQLIPETLQASTQKNDFHRGLLIIFSVEGQILLVKLPSWLLRSAITALLSYELRELQSEGAPEQSKVSKESTRLGKGAMAGRATDQG